MTPLRILIAHGSYRQRGGEDVVADQEAALLEQRGNTVLRYTRTNHDVDESQPIRTAVQTLWSHESSVAMRRLIRQFRPDIVHVHNTFPLLSPSLYWSIARTRTPIVQTLHNFRLLCPQAMLLRNGTVCESCVGRTPLHAVVHRCYRDSMAKSAVIAGMLTMHRAMGTYRHKVDRYIALNEFCRRKFIAGGLPADKIAVKPNFADLPTPDPFVAREGALFAGRVAAEKGVGMLLDALELLPNQRINIVGDGPELSRMQAQPRVDTWGRLPADQLFAMMRTHAYLVMPSLWYENSPRTLIEAFGCGLPVITTRLGALAELVEDGQTGLLFEPGSAIDLAAKIHWAETHPEEMKVMGMRARREFERRYTPGYNYMQLIDVYRQAMESHQRELAA